MHHFTCQLKKACTVIMLEKKLSEITTCPFTIIENNDIITISISIVSMFWYNSILSIILTYCIIFEMQIDIVKSLNKKTLYLEVAETLKRNWEDKLAKAQNFDDFIHLFPILEQDVRCKRLLFLFLEKGTSIENSICLLKDEQKTTFVEQKTHISHILHDWFNHISHKKLNYIGILKVIQHLYQTTSKN